MTQQFPRESKLDFLRGPVVDVLIVIGLFLAVCALAMTIGLLLLTAVKTVKATSNFSATNATMPRAKTMLPRNLRYTTRSSDE